MFAYTLTTLTLCCTSILIASNISKRKGTLMEYMVFIMSFSMSIGLSIGFYLGILFKGELLYSTLLAILISGSTFSSIYCFRRNVLWINGKYDGSNDYRNVKRSTSSQYIVHQPFTYYNDYYVLCDSIVIGELFYFYPTAFFVITFNQCSNYRCRIRDIPRSYSCTWA